MRQGSTTSATSSRSSTATLCLGAGGVLNKADNLAGSLAGCDAVHVSQHGTTRSIYVEWSERSLGSGVRQWLQAVPDDAGPAEQLHLPHGGVEVRWRRGDRPMLIGPTIKADIETIGPGDEVIGFRFNPGRWPDLAACSIHELVGTVQPLSDVLGVGCDADTGDSAEARRRALRRVLTTVLPSRVGEAQVTTDIVDAAHLHDRPVSQIALTAGWSERHARRRTRQTTGLTIRDLRRIGRFQRFVTAVQHDLAHKRRRPLAELAALAGYADQSHLQRASQTFAGLTLTEYLDRTHHNCAGHNHQLTHRTG